MNDGSITDEQAHRWLQQIVDGPVIDDATGELSGSWVSLHYDTPALGDEDKAEISGGGYQRFKMKWSQPNNRAIWSLVDARFTGLTQTKLVYFGVWSLKSKGLLRAYGELPAPVVVANGKGYVLHAGQLAISFG